MITDAPIIVLVNAVLPSFESLLYRFFGLRFFTNLALHYMERTNFQLVHKRVIVERHRWKFESWVSELNDVGAYLRVGHALEKTHILLRWLMHDFPEIIFSNSDLGSTKVIFRDDFFFTYNCSRLTAVDDFENFKFKSLYSEKLTSPLSGIRKIQLSRNWMMAEWRGRHFGP